MVSFQNFIVVQSATLIWYSMLALKAKVGIELCDADIVLIKKKKE